MIKVPQWGNIFEIGFRGRHKHTNWQLSVQNTLKPLLRLRLGSGRKKWGKKYPFSFERCSAPGPFFYQNCNWTMVECTLNHDQEDLFSRCRPIAVFYKIKHNSFWKKFYFCSSLTQSDFFWLWGHKYGYCCRKVNRQCLWSRGLSITFDTQYWWESSKSDWWVEHD